AVVADGWRGPVVVSEVGAELHSRMSNSATVIVFGHPNPAPIHVQAADSMHQHVGRDGVLGQRCAAENPVLRGWLESGTPTIAEVLGFRKSRTEQMNQTVAHLEPGILERR